MIQHNLPNGILCIFLLFFRVKDAIIPFTRWNDEEKVNSKEETKKKKRKKRGKKILVRNMKVNIQIGTSKLFKSEWRNRSLCSIPIYSACNQITKCETGPTKPVSPAKKT